jgi:hypothetical protein
VLVQTVNLAVIQKRKKKKSENVLFLYAVFKALPIFTSSSLACGAAFKGKRFHQSANYNRQKLPN